MKIVNIDANYIYAYMDGTFLIFDKNKYITGAEIIGMAWAAGKVKHPKKLIDAPPLAIKMNTNYHNGLNIALIKIAENNPDK